MSNIVYLRRKFLNSLKRGTGEAYIIAKENPSLDFTDLIIKGIQRNFAYDGQCEPSRAEYVFGLFPFSKQSGKLREALINGLRNKEIDSWDLTHLSDLAKIYVQESADEEVKTAIYERFLNPPNYSGYWHEGELIIELDGFDGLVHVCEKIGSAILAKVDENFDDWLIRFYEKKFDVADARQKLELLAKDSKAISTFLTATQNESDIFNVGFEIQKNIESDDVVDKILGSHSLVNLPELSKKDIVKIANRLQSEKDSDVKRELMWVFTKIKYPLDYRYLLKVATKRNRHSLQDVAVSALALIRNSEVRDFALRGIENPRSTDWELSGYLDVLKLNYRAGDDKLLANLIKECSDEHRLHSISQSCIAIYENVKSKKCQVPLELLYDKTCCGHCRWSIVKILIANHVLPERILREIQYDSDLDLRTIYEHVS